MSELVAIDALERGGELGRAYSLLAERWRAGARDRESAMRLLFLAWYLAIEPSHLTGAPPGLETRLLFREVFEARGAVRSSDAEVLYAVGEMLSFAPWFWDDERAGAELGAACLARARARMPRGYPPEHYAGRGAYGDYFAHIGRTGSFGGGASAEGEVAPRPDDDRSTRRR